MFDAKTASPEQVSQLIAEMKEAKNKAFMLQNRIDEVFIHSKNSGLSIFHDEEDQELYFLNCFEGNSKGISMISTDATAVREFMACKGVKEYQKLVKKHTVKVD